MATMKQEDLLCRPSVKSIPFEVGGIHDDYRCRMCLYRWGKKANWSK